MRVAGRHSSMVIARKFDRPTSPPAPVAGGGAPEAGAGSPGEAGVSAVGPLHGRERFRNARDRVALQIERILLNLPKLPLP